MYTILSNSGRRTYGVKEYAVQTFADISTIPLLNTVASGSTVLVIESKQKYILTKERIWAPAKSNEPFDPEEVVYEGGDIDTDSEQVADIAYEGGEFE